MKMKVGDLTMVQGEGISVNGETLVSRQSTPQMQRHTTPTRRDGLRLGPVSFPHWSARTYMTAAALFGIMSIAVLVIGLLNELPVVAMLALNAMAGAVASGILAQRARTQPTPSVPPSAITIERRTRLLTHLQASGEPQTIEALQTSLGWTDEALLPTLADLVQAERIDEDLDMESGHWTYALPAPRMVLDTESSPTALPDHARPISERVEALSSTSSR